MTNIEITLNGCRFDLTQGTIQAYERVLNLRTGLLTRNMVWTSPKEETFNLKFERVVSLKRLHTIALRVSVTPEADAAVTFQSGIDGRVTCDGFQHFTEGQTRFYDKKYSSQRVRYLGYDIFVSRSKDTKRSKNGTLRRAWYGT